MPTNRAPQPPSTTTEVLSADGACIGEARMKRFLRLSVVLILVLAAVAVVDFASANHIVCNSKYTSAHSSSTWQWMGPPNDGYNYTDWSDWSANYFVARRIDSSGATTYNQSGQGYLLFDNGTFSPWRMSGLYNSGVTTTTYFEQGNDNGGSCN